MKSTEIKVAINLNKGQLCNIYTDYKEEIGYEGQAILIEKIKDGDSFYLNNERIKPIDKKEYSKQDLAEITKYNRLVTFFKGTKSKKPSIYCRRLYRDLKKIKVRDINSFDLMKVVLSKYRKKHSDSINSIKSLLSEYDDYYIIRFVQQYGYSNWQPSIFSYERWKVNFVSDDRGWETNWATARNIRVLKCYSPAEKMRRSELIEHTTYNAISSRIFENVRNKSEYLKKLDKKNNEPVFIEDDEMEELIKNKLKEHELRNKTK